MIVFHNVEYSVVAVVQEISRSEITRTNCYIGAKSLKNMERARYRNRQIDKQKAIIDIISKKDTARGTNSKIVR